MVSIARLKLRYRAKQFIESEPSLQTTTDWNILKDNLKRQFTRQYVKGSAMKNFMECRQRSNETCRQFLTRLKILANRTITLTGDPAHDNPIKQKLEQDITTQFSLGLTMPIKQRVLSGNPTDLDAALVIAEREQSIENLLHPSGSRECRIINNNQNRANTSQQTSRYKETATVRSCYTCHEPGHFSADCPRNKNQHVRQQRTPDEVKCYSCQKTGHIARNCPTQESRYQQRSQYQSRNNQGNQSRSQNQIRNQYQARNQGSLNSNTASFQPRSQAVNEAQWE